MVSKQTGLIITAVMTVLFGCAALFTCLAGVTSAGNVLRSTRLLGEPLAGSGVYAGLGANLCTALGFIALPVVFYVILVAHNKESAAPPETADPPRPEDPA